MSTYRDANCRLPPRLFVSPLSGMTYNGVPPPEADLLAAGFLPCVLCERPEGNYRETWTLEGGKWYQGWEAYKPAPVVVEYSKRKLRVALKARGLNTALNTLFGLSPEFAEAWSDATTLESADPDFQAAMEAFKGIAGCDDETLAAVLAEAAV